MSSTPGQGFAHSPQALHSPHRPPHPSLCQPASVPSCPMGLNSKPSPGCSAHLPGGSGAVPNWTQSLGSSGYGAACHLSP